jgi:hypothetical protein
VNCHAKISIAAQAEVELPDGVSGEEADTLLSEYGGECLVEVLTALEKGTLTRRPQPQGGSYFPAPQDRDFVIDPAWSARHAFNFMRGTNEWGQPSHTCSVETVSKAWWMIAWGVVDAIALMPNTSPVKPLLAWFCSKRFIFPNRSPFQSDGRLPEARGGKSA